MLILLNKRWKSGSCLLLACQTMANKHSFPWLQLFITVWILECNYALNLSFIIHTIIIPWLNYLFIARGDICSVSLEDFFLGGVSHCLALHREGVSRRRPSLWVPGLSVDSLDKLPSYIYSCCWRKTLGKRNFRAINVWECLQFSELSWEGLFILAIIISWSLI